MNKKKVIAYLHTHWDREWYREFEVFRLRLLRVFDNVLNLLEQNKIPSFYFDGQVVALLDYLKMRPEKEKLVKKLIKNKKLFIGPFYCLVDEFLTDDTCFRKNLEIGLKISKEFGCKDFIGYFADTFGHSKSIPNILKDYNIDKAMVWRGVGDLPSEFKFNGINTVNLARGYFNDLFSTNLCIEDKAKKLEDELDKISQISTDYILLPIGADHLGIESNISEQIKHINSYLKNYHITIGSPFDYFKKVKFNTEWNDELRDNTKTFILSGCYSARTKLKQYNTQCCYLLKQADKLQKKYGGKYKEPIEYAYKLLLKNQAHDSICGCSTDDVHQENIVRYKKILQIANTIIEELRLVHKFKTPIMKSDKPINGYHIINEEIGVDNSLLYDTQKIPVTEDFKTIYTLRKNYKRIADYELKLINKKLYLNEIEIQFTRHKDLGDTYNYGADKSNTGEIAKIISLNDNIISTDFFDIKYEKGENLINFTINWDNQQKNTLWQVKFILKDDVTETYSEDMGILIHRKFNPNYNFRENLPKDKGIEVATNFAPMQRLVWTQNFGIITKGLTEYEIYKNSVAITILRSTGIISNPKNPCRTTPAGPPILVPEAQQLGPNTAEFSVGFFSKYSWQKRIKEVYPDFC